jgi:hypothetical protein
MTEIDILKAQIVRHDVSQPWGFRLEGGADIGESLRITQITPGSPAASIGLRESDEVTEIFDTPTEHLTYQQSLDLIHQYHDILVLTVERQARGTAPVTSFLSYREPEVSNHSPKPYQPLDMTGSSFYSPPARRPVNFHTVQSKPFENLSTPSRTQYPEHQHFPASNDYQENQFSSAAVSSNNAEIDQGIPQSRTFRILQSVMQNDERAAGAAGLPPPRSASMEQMKREKAHQKMSAQPGRVKVFMPQQYNSPIGMYSADNVLETFTAQAQNILMGESRDDYGDGCYGNSYGTDL